MENKIQDLLLSCSEIDFGEVSLSKEEKEFLNELNHEIILHCKSLPQSMQTDALLFFIRYSGTSFNEGINFFRFAYVPTWSIIYWLIQCTPHDKHLEEINFKNAKTAHSIAVFLHYLDHQLNDNEIPITHLVLLLRSHLWMIMNNAFESLADGVDGGEEIIQGFIEDYYSSINGSSEIETLDAYRDLFKKQMGTGFISPVLLSKKMKSHEEFDKAIQKVFGSFGFAWRLLDDIQDLGSDMMKGAKSSIYICLPEKLKNYWDKPAPIKLNKKNDYTRIILDYIIQNNVIDKIKERICIELETAASVADYYKMKGLADEFRCISKPLMDRQDRV